MSIFERSLSENDALEHSTLVQFGEAKALPDLNPGVLKKVHRLRVIVVHKGASKAAFRRANVIDYCML
jgi:hypothetical protein